MSALDLRAARRVLAAGLPLAALCLAVFPSVLCNVFSPGGHPLRGTAGFAVGPLLAVVVRAIWVAYAPFLTATVTNPRRTHLFRVGETGFDWLLMGSVVAGPVVIPVLARGRFTGTLLVGLAYAATLALTLELLRRRMQPARTGDLRWFDQRLENYRVLRTGLIIGTLATVWVGGGALAFHDGLDAGFAGSWLGIGTAVIALLAYWPFFLVWMFEDLAAAPGWKLLGLLAGVGLLFPAYQGVSHPIDAVIALAFAGAFVTIMELLRRRAFSDRAVVLASTGHADGLRTTYGVVFSPSELQALAGRGRATTHAPAAARVQIATTDALARAQHVVVALGLVGVGLCVVGAFGPGVGNGRLLWAGQLTALLGAGLWVAAIQRSKRRGLVVEPDALVFRVGHEERRIARDTAYFGVERRGNALQVTLSDGAAPPVAVPGLVLRSTSKPTTITLRDRSDLLGWTDTETQWNGDPARLAGIIAWAEALAPAR